MTPAAACTNESDKQLSDLPFAKEGCSDTKRIRFPSIPTFARRSFRMSKNLMDKEVTRRQFMAMTSKGIAGVAISTSLLNLMGVTRAQADAGLVSTIATPDYLLVANGAKCTGCQRCEYNCSMVNEGEVRPYLSRIRVRQNMYFGANGPTEDYRHGDGVYGNWSFAPDTCKQCANPACANACPMSAISADPVTGARVIDEDKCIGCGMCVNACPWHMPRINPEKRKSTKCISCGACVAGCPTSALRMIPWEDVAAAM